MSISRNTRAAWRRSLIATTAGGVIAAGLVVATTTAAVATHPSVVGTPFCDTKTGLQGVDWRVGGDSAYPDETAVIKSQSLATNPTLVGKTVKGNTQTASGTQTGTIAPNTKYTMTVKVQFSNHRPGDLVEQTGSVKTGGDCQSTSVKDASASISITPATCDSPEKLVLGQAVNATWSTPTRTTGPGLFSVVATGNAGPPQHLFNPGPGVSTDGKTQTFTGGLKGVDTSQSCWAKDAAASVGVKPGTCEAPGSASVTGLQHAALVGTLDQSVGTHVATFQSNNGHLFSNGTDTLQVSYTVPGKDTSKACSPPKAKKVRGAVKKIDKCEYNNFVFLKKVKGLHYVKAGKVVREGVWVRVKATVAKIKVKADSAKYQVVGKTLFVVKFPNNADCYTPPDNPPNSGG